MGKSIMELRQEMGGFVGEMKRMNDIAGGENRTLTESESKRWDELDRLVQDLKSRIRIEERTSDLVTEMQQPAIIPGPECFTSYTGQSFAPTTRVSTFTNSFRNLFPQASTNSSEYRSFDELAAEVVSGRNSDRLQRLNSRAMTIDPGSSGGYAVPTPITEFLLDNSLESEVIRPRAVVIPMTSDSLKVPRFDGYDHSSGTFGGWTPAWVAEDGELSVTAPKLEQLVLRSYKLYLFGQVSRELYSDAPGIKNAISTSMSKALAWSLDNAFINGTGAGQPLGLLNSPCKIEVTRSGQSLSDAIDYDNIVDMWSRLHPASATRATWLGNPSVIPRLMNIYRSTGTNSGESVDFFNNTTGTFTLFGRPLVLTEKLPALSYAGDLVLCDLNQYLIGLRQDLIVDQTDSYQFNKDRISIRALLRVDGMMSQTAATTLANGSTTVGPLIVLGDCSSHS